MSLPISYDGTLPDLKQGAVWSVRISAKNEDGSVVDLTSYAIVIYLDPPLDTAGERKVLVKGDGSSTTAGDGSYVDFTKDQAWSAALVGGMWTGVVCFGPRSAPLEQTTFRLPVVATTKGALS